jgi:membrane fusion protein (multidrug efflux system)
LDLIAKLENADLEHSVLLSEDAVKLAKEQYDKYTLVFAKSNAISQKSLDDAKAAWITAQKALATAKQELDQTKFIAPFAGIVGVYKIRDGSQVTQGEQILTFYDPNEIIIEFNIPANYLKQINNGQTVIIGNKLLHIEHIQKMVDPNTNMSPAIVDYPCENCFIGENIDVDLIVAKKNNVLVIPSSAVFLKNGVTSVYIVENNKAILKPVTTGLQEKEQIEIIEGIKELDVVIVCGQSRLYPFAKVKIFQAEK